MGCDRTKHNNKRHSYKIGHKGRDWNGHQAGQNSTELINLMVMCYVQFGNLYVCLLHLIQNNLHIMQKHREA